ncbi:MAG: PfkB family carbohydrate kinase, partial [Ghiorsea sp.]
IKTGMLYDESHLKAFISSKTALFPDAALVVDPVLIASSGKSLFQAANTRKAYADLLQHATLWTPNLQEAAYLSEQHIADPVELAAALLLKYRIPVLLKGGHGKGEILRDVFCDQDGNVETFEHQKQRINQAQAHGTGCRLASAIAAHLAHHESLSSAVAKAHRWLQKDLAQ